MNNDVIQYLLFIIKTLKVVNSVKVFNINNYEIYIF